MRFLADENFPGGAVAAIEICNDWARHFSMIDNNKIRMRKL
jgi:hypothetical protein